MPLASSLTNYLSSRVGQCSFRLGEWLASVTDAELASLIALADHSIEANEASAPELLTIYLLGIGAERGVASKEIWIEAEKAARFSTHVGFLAVVEDFRRKGMLFVKEMTSIDNFEQNQIAITEKGLSEAEIMNRHCPQTDFQEDQR